MIKINDREAIVVGELYKAFKQDSTSVGIFQGGGSAGAGASGNRATS